MSPLAKVHADDLTTDHFCRCMNHPGGVWLIGTQLHHHVRVDSVLLLRAAQQVISEEGFDEALDQTRERVDEIEGLRQTWLC